MNKSGKYSAYKESGVEWLGEIPVGWKVKKLKFMFSFSKGLTITKENLVNKGIPCVNYGEIHSKYGFEVNPEIHDLKCVKDSYLQSNSKSLLELGDFVFADTSEDIEGSGNFTYLNSNVKTFAGYHTIICRLKEKNNSRFYAYIFDSLSYRHQIRNKVKGVKVYSITQSVLKETFIWIPPKQEQIKIATFLDAKAEQLDKAIKQKQQLIELLKERRQILINDSVTKGLDKTVAMKDSGVEWIGNIPVGWEVKKLKNISNINQNSLAENSHKDYKIEYVDIGNVNFEKGILKIESFLFKNAPSRARRRAKVNDSIISTVRTYLKAIDFVSEEKSKYVYSTGFAILEPMINLSPMFLSFFLKSNFFTNQVDLNSKGISYPAINSTDLNNLLSVIPPKQEQIKIAIFLDTKTAQLDKAIDLQQQQINKLKEYKTTLIDSVVTGKVRVCDE